MLIRKHAKRRESLCCNPIYLEAMFRPKDERLFVIESLHDCSAIDQHVQRAALQWHELDSNRKNPAAGLNAQFTTVD